MLFLRKDLFGISLKVHSCGVNVQKDTWYLYAHSEGKQSPFDARLDHFPFKVECSTSEVKTALCHECCRVCFPHMYLQPCSYVVFILNNGAAAIMSRHLAKFITPSTSVLAPLVSAPAQVRARHFDLLQKTVNAHLGRRARGKRYCSVPPASAW